jgi:tRNA dimethylallyltransferase
VTPAGRPRLVSILGATAAGKSALGIALARHFGGEVVGCDSTAVFRGIDIGTDKVPLDEQQGISHHLIDVAEPTEVYSAARYARDAAAAIHDIAARGRVPILAGGTGFYYRALVRGLFPGPERDDALRARLDRVADRRGVESLHRWLSRVDADSATRIQPRDQKRLVRALEVYLLTGRPLTAHFAETVSPLGAVDIVALGVVLPRPVLRPRVAARVEAQFARGVIAEVMEFRQGVRDLDATRELIVRENMRYARRQHIWFRKEPGVQWLEGAGESPAIQQQATTAVVTMLRNKT